MSQTPHPANQLLLLGVGQAIGFVGGALLGRWLGLAMGFDALAEGYGYELLHRERRMLGGSPPTALVPIVYLRAPSLAALRRGLKALVSPALVSP